MKMSDDPIRQCGLCEHWEGVGTGGPMVAPFGICRFNPPVVLSLDDGPGDGWASTYANDWCHQFKYDAEKDT